MAGNGLVLEYLRYHGNIIQNLCNCNLEQGCEIIVKHLKFSHPRMESENYSGHKNYGLKNCICKSQKHVKIKFV